MGTSSRGRRGSDDDASDAAEGDAAVEAVFHGSLRQFAEGATALTAASIRLQMMMLEQARGMMGDMADVFGDAPPDRKPDD
ncbi:MAG TPA: hypothetical protein VLA52_03770 [Thermohalobaculum sp.]|nr:hypothetical protein [Thermohalobaculum sp.]